MTNSDGALAAPPSGTAPYAGSDLVGRYLGRVVLGIAALIVLTPVGYILYGSLRTGSPGAKGAVFTAANWLRVYTSEAYLSAFGSTVMLSATVGLLSILLGGGMAWIVARTNAPGRDRLGLMIIVPLMISNLITTLAWIALAAPNAGFINAAFKALTGYGPIFDIYSFKGIVLVLTTDYSAFAFIALYAALRSIDGALEEVSYMLGAGPVQTGLRMTLPLIWPSIASTFLLIFVMTAENFSVPTLLGAAFGFETLPSRIYMDMTVEPSTPTMAAAAGTMLLWIAIAGTWWQRRILRRAGMYTTISGKGSRPRITDLGRWRWAATGMLAAFVGIAVVLPYAALVLSSFMGFLTPRLSLRVFTVENYTQLLRPSNVTAIVNSLTYSVLGGGGITLVYAVLAYLIKSERGLLGRLAEYLALIPTAIPAIVLGIGILWTFVVVPLPIYGTAAILIIAYFIRYIGLGIRTARTGLAQISDDLPDAARMAGASPLRAMRDVTLPLLRPSALALWTLLFMSIFTEISVTILLYSYNTITLPVLLWNDMASGHQTGAFAVAVLQATTMFVMIYAANRRFGILRTTLGA